MKQLTIQSSSHAYDVIIGAGLRKKLSQKLGKSYKKILIVTDSKVSSLYLEDVKAGLPDHENLSHVIVPAGEASKSMEQYSRLLDKCIEEQLDRSSLIVGLGGGMVGDLAGFVASTYLRGVDFLQMPTTILAHDSSVGGKVAINHEQGKNLIGSFYSPVQVIYDTDTLRTLPDSEVRSGYGEVVKHALLSDMDWVKEVLSEDFSELSYSQLGDHLLAGIKVKASIVEEDEKEHGVRRHLNLGHTLAHALESDLGYGEITHGEAVAIGIFFAMKVSEKVLESTLPVDAYSAWLKTNEYPVEKLSNLNPERLVNRMKWDKKTIEDRIHFVLLKGVGSPAVVPIPEDDLVNHLKEFIEEVIQIDERD
ncbi:3-dehydroquinate synthase [Halobacillus campisalis]|uniref:3-dehydroquinate synthase n=1 Tax=Halobacillus campisalis TaxID=435909 RepID=A0ABW2K3D7_9BACI|nr:3-dehydroquinate synthase [Halobacillus campisalis]